ncbi:hypothetical protein KAH27_05840 [bacterium]|nr:hypothetical protein [bacterium]
MTNFLELPAEVDVTKIKEFQTAKKSFGTPVTIKREKNRITLSQTKGAFFKTPAIITWVEPKTKKSRTR